MSDASPTLGPGAMPVSPSGHMLVRNAKVAVFHQATMAALMAVLNNYFTGVAIAGVGAQPAYAAGFSAEHTFVGLQLEASGTDFVAILTYAD